MGGGGGKRRGHVGSGGGGGGGKEKGACWERGLGMNELLTTFLFFTFALARWGQGILLYCNIFLRLVVRKYYIK